MEQVLQVKMLGEFTVSLNGKEILKDDGRSRKVWNLFAYLLANRNKTISGTELTDLLCSDERSDDPAKAVKNLAYRLRVLINDSGLPQADYVVQSGGSYRWNNELPIRIDTEEFEEIYKEAKWTLDDEEKAKELFYQAIDCYGGLFLPTFPYEEWAVTFATRYQRTFVDSVVMAHQLSSTEEDYNRLIDICERAITYDPYDEYVYRVYIDSLVKLDRQQDAMTAYETITNRLYTEMGVNPSKELLNLYRTIIKTIKSVENDLLIIKDGLNEPGSVDGAYCSEYEIFKDVYRFVARGVERSGSSIFIMLCTITDQFDLLPEQEYLTTGMTTLKDVIGSTLRKGDLFAQYSCTQYVIMLPSLTYENGIMVSQRIGNAFKKKSISKYIKLHFKLQPLDPKSN